MADKRYYHGHRPYYNRNKAQGNNSDNANRAPHPQFQTVPELEKAVEDNPTEETIVKAIATAWNKYCWYEENESKLEADSEKYSDACDQTDSWCELYYRLIAKLKALLQIDSDTVFALPELTTYMGKYSLEDVDGIWKIKKSKPQSSKNDV